MTTLALLGASCAATPRVEVAPPTTDGAPASSTTLEPDANAVAAPPDNADPDNTDPAGPTTEVPAATEQTDQLLAGGVDPATLLRSPRGEILVQPTPLPLENRQLPTAPLLDPPQSNAFESTIAPLEGGPLAASTWNELCPVPPTNLSYVTVSFWGFDGLHHRGELIVAANEAENMVGVFERLHAIRFPIEEMRLVTPTDLFSLRTGDGNNTASYVCRQVTGGTRFSEHALGLAIDINPFQNPYQRGEEVIPALASSYLDRGNVRPGMIVRGDPAGDEVIAAFAEIGWAWGGEWNSLKDYQHFSRNNR